MNALLHTAFAAGFLLAMVNAPLLAQEPATLGATWRTPARSSSSPPTHRSKQTAPLFGANEERKWAPDWKPQFVYPNPARDQQGMVFQVAHGHTPAHGSTPLLISPAGTFNMPTC